MRRKRLTVMEQLQATVAVLGTMLADAAQEARQRQLAAAGDRPTPAELNREMKELTAVLKDLTGVAKAMEPGTAEAAVTGVILLPEVEQDAE